MANIEISPEVLREKFAEIAVLDEKIAAASGSADAGKRALANAFANEHADQVKPIVDQISEKVLNTLSGEALAGVYTGIVNTLRDAFFEDVDEFLKAEVENRKSDVEKPSDEELAAILENRKTLVEEYKALRGILEMFGHDVSDIPEPKRMTGSRGPRGPRTLSGFNYFIDGEPRTKTQNTLSSVANTITKDLGWKTKDLKDYLVSQGMNIDEPGDEWEYTLPNGKVLKGVKKTQEEIDAEKADEGPTDPNEED